MSMVAHLQSLLRSSAALLFWIGLGLLSASWAFGVEYFSRTHSSIWATLMIGGILFLIGAQLADPQGRGEIDAGRGESVPAQLLVAIAVTMVLLAGPAIFLLSWPQRIGPVLLAISAVLMMLPGQHRWCRAVASGVFLSGAVLVIQALALAAYKQGTARSHELPWPLPELLAAAV